MSGRVLMGRSQEQAGAEGQGQGKVRPQGTRDSWEGAVSGPFRGEFTATFRLEGAGRACVPLEEALGNPRAKEGPGVVAVPPSARP